jgi:hypothetical protein
MDNIGLTNAAIDLAYEAEWYPKFFYENNTYEPLIDNATFSEISQSVTSEGGCLDAIAACRTSAAENDPNGDGLHVATNELCRAATLACFEGILGLPKAAGVSPFDIAIASLPEIGDPCPYLLPVDNFLNQAWTQDALGVGLNFSYISNAVLKSYTLHDAAIEEGLGTGAGVLPTKASIEYLLENDVKVALVYGDRDARCPWVGALNAAVNVNYTGQTSFVDAGYEYIQVNESFAQGGAVKQFGAFSFSRVFNSGHAVNAYQPEVVNAIVRRTIGGMDVATGEIDVDGEYATEGPASSWDMIDQTLPETPGTCMVLGSFQEESVWTEVFEAVQAQSDAGGEGSSEGGEEAEAGSGSGEGDGESESAATRVFGSSLAGALTLVVAFLLW